MTFLKFLLGVAALLLLLVFCLSPVILIVLGVVYFIKKKKRQDKALEMAIEQANSSRTSEKKPSYEEWKAMKKKEARGEVSEEYSYKWTDLGINRLDLIEGNNHSVKPPKRKPKQEKASPQWDSVNLHPHHPTDPAPKAEPRPERKDTGYEAVSIVTPNEMANYKTLKEAADKKGYTITLKARLADLVAPHKGQDYMARFGKIKSKHVDFTILDSQLRTIAVIELDDSSHDRPDRIKRDQFVDETLESCGIKVIHTRHITPDILDNI